MVMTSILLHWGANASSPGDRKMRIGGASSGTDNITEITVGVHNTCSLGIIIMVECLCEWIRFDIHRSTFTR